MEDLPRLQRNREGEPLSCGNATSRCDRRRIVTDKLSLSERIEKLHPCDDPECDDDAHALAGKVKELESAAQDFIDKVESGRARSVDSYAKFKKALRG